MTIYEILTIMTIILMNILAHFFEPSHSIFLRNHTEIKKQLDNQDKILKEITESNNRILNLLNLKINN